MNAEPMLFEVQSALATATLQRPRRRNPQDAAVTRALGSASIRAASDEARVVAGGCS